VESGVTGYSSGGLRNKGVLTGHRPSLNRGGSEFQGNSGGGFERVGTGSKAGVGGDLMSGLGLCTYEVGKEK